ncbi:TPA: ATP-binding protein [Candidatus Woesearchaeota archaeon]|nr:ATP-binding protein [Candidatus Woesearchaeota archaeon]
MEPFCIIIRGPPAVGKSTIAKQLAAEIPNTVHVDIDRLKHMISLQSSVPRTEIAHDVAKYFMKRLIQHKYNIVVEELFKEKHLRPISSILKKAGYRTTQVFLTAPTKVALKRNSEREKNKEEEIVLALHKEITPRDDDIIIDTAKSSIKQSVARIKRAI